MQNINYNVDGSGLLIVVNRRKKNDPCQNSTAIRRIRLSKIGQPMGGLASLGAWAKYESRLIMTVFEFSLRSAFNLKFRWFEAGARIRLIHHREFELEPYGWTRTLSGLQALLSLYMVALWLLSYFGRPFG